MTNIRSTRTHGGFTLVELLIVIGIVAVVAAILFPVFASSRERGRRTVCQSNLRQIALAMQQYVQDNSGVYPLDHAVEARGGVSYLVTWSEVVLPYVKDDRVFRCPAHPADADEVVTPGPGTGDAQFTDYTYDLPRFNLFPPPYPTKNVQGVRETALVTPATTWMNEDAGWISPDGTYHYCRMVPKSSCGRSFIGSILHSNGGNYSFADGHVKWLTPESMGEIECAEGPLPAPFKD